MCLFFKWLISIQNFATIIQMGNVNLPKYGLMLNKRTHTVQCYLLYQLRILAHYHLVYQLHILAR